jgi:aminopeptidase N
MKHVNEKTKTDYSYFFEQYLKSAEIPQLQYKVRKSKGKFILSYKWKSEVKGFNMPVYLKINKEKVKLEPSTKEYKKIELNQFSQGLNPGFKFGLFELIEDFNNELNYIAW